MPNENSTYLQHVDGIDIKQASETVWSEKHFFPEEQTFKSTDAMKKAFLSIPKQFNCTEPPCTPSYLKTLREGTFERTDGKILLYNKVLTGEEKNSAYKREISKSPNADTDVKIMGSKKIEIIRHIYHLPTIIKP